MNNEQDGRGCYTGCFFSMCFWLLLVATCTSSCTAPRFTALVPHGQVDRQDGDRLLITFENAGEQSSFAYEWFYFPGLEKIDCREYEAELIIRKRRRDE